MIRYHERVHIDASLPLSELFCSLKYSPAFARTHSARSLVISLPRISLGISLSNTDLRGREIYPADRQSFIHNPLEVLGVAAGLAFPSISAEHREWFANTIIRGMTQSQFRTPLSQLSIRKEFVPTPLATQFLDSFVGNQISERLFCEGGEHRRQVPSVHIRRVRPNHQADLLTGKSGLLLRPSAGKRPVN
jgi:hypothetical protein